MPSALIPDRSERRQLGGGSRDGGGAVRTAPPVGSARSPSLGASGGPGAEGPGGVAGSAGAAAPRLRRTGPVVSNVYPNTSPSPNASTPMYSLKSLTSPSMPMLLDQLRM